MTKPFELTLSATQRITGEYRPGKQIVIFSHGFDVQRDSNGLFHDIARDLPPHYGYVLFDYHFYQGVEENLRPLSEQAAVLKHVIHWTKNLLRPMSIHLIAHSMGCVVASIAGDASFDTITFLAPPLKKNNGLRRFFTGHPNARHTGTHWEIKRRSGKITRVSDKLFLESESANPSGLIRAYAAHHPIRLIYAKQDRFIPEELYHELKGSPGLSIQGIPGDHNFSEAARSGLLTALKRV